MESGVCPSRRNNTPVRTKRWDRATGGQIFAELMERAGPKERPGENGSGQGCSMEGPLLKIPCGQNEV